LGLSSAKAHEKEIPKIILESTKSNVASFLRGLFDTDGTADTIRALLSMCTVSEKLAKQVQMCLLNFGIISSVKRNCKGKGRDFYIVQCNGVEAKKFHQEIGFGCQRKRDIVEKMIAVKFNTNKDIIPFQREIVKKIYKDVKKWNKGLYDKVYHVIIGNNQLTYSKLCVLLSLNRATESSEYKHLYDLAQSNYFFAKISDIQDSNNFVYDLSMLETNSFISNGIVSHNTFDEVLCLMLASIYFPAIDLAVTAQTQENSAKLLEAKYREIIKYYPMLASEVIKANFPKGDAEIIFLNDSTISNLANSESSKGQRKRRIAIEESALLNNVIFDSALKPIVDVPRRTVGVAAVVDPMENNQQINFFTTSGFRASYE
jgi:ribonucleoside-diphosphate reductase alpha chain